MTCDLIYAINHLHPLWLESRAMVAIDLLTGNGIKAEVFNCYGLTRDEIIDCVETKEPRVVINATMSLHHGRTENLASRFPRVKWVTTCHSSQSDLARNSCWLRGQTAFLDLARRKHNCYYGLVDERADFYQAFSCPRLIHLNNCALQLDDAPHLALHDPPIVSLICCWRQLKNIPNQLIALSLASKITPLKVLLSVKDDRESLAERFAKSVSLCCDVRPWRPWRDYRQMIAEDVDVGLQVSFTESFNFVALDHMLAAKPVIGSPAIRYLPSEWQSNSDDPEDIARRLVNVLSNYRESSALAERIAKEKVESSNAAFLSTIRALLDGAI